MGKSDRRDHTGGAEQFYANAKAKESAEAAVVACAAEGVPQDAECFICKSSIEGKGIVRGCACRGTTGLAHVSCLVRQAQVAAAEARETERAAAAELRELHADLAAAKAQVDAEAISAELSAAVKSSLQPAAATGGTGTTKKKNTDLSMANMTWRNMSIYFKTWTSPP